MLVVVAIIGLIVGVSMPSVTAGLDSVRMATATSSVAGFLNRALTHVERRQQPIELIISPAEGRIQVFSNEPGFERELKMPDGVVIEGVLPENEGDPRGARHLLLLPGATAPGIGIVLSNRHGTRRIVHLDPMTGFPKVESVEAK